MYVTLASGIFIDSARSRISILLFQDGLNLINKSMDCLVSIACCVAVKSLVVVV